MTTVHLLIEDDYIEEFMAELPKGKVVVIEEEFKENQKKLKDVLDDYNNQKSEFVPYYESMKALNGWLKEREA